MIAQAKRHLPSLFESDFDLFKGAARKKAGLLAEKVFNSPKVLSMDPDQTSTLVSTMILLWKSPFRLSNSVL
jgi:hypothetical protein